MPARSAPSYPLEGVFRGGEFLADTLEEHVYCGLCHADFRYPYSKAEHLATMHYAHISKRIDSEGNVLYTWRLP